MQVPLRGGQISVPHPCLDRRHGHAALEPEAGCGVPEVVQTSASPGRGPSGRVAEGFGVELAAVDRRQEQIGLAAPRTRRQFSGFSPMPFKPPAIWRSSIASLQSDWSQCWGLWRAPGPSSHSVSWISAGAVRWSRRKPWRQPTTFVRASRQSEMATSPSKIELMQSTHSRSTSRRPWRSRPLPGHFSTTATSGHQRELSTGRSENFLGSVRTWKPSYRRETCSAAPRCRFHRRLGRCFAVTSITSVSNRVRRLVAAPRWRSIREASPVGRHPS